MACLTCLRDSKQSCRTTCRGRCSCGRWFLCPGMEPEVKTLSRKQAIKSLHASKRALLWQSLASDRFPAEFSKRLAEGIQGLDGPQWSAVSTEQRSAKRPGRRRYQNAAQAWEPAARPKQMRQAPYFGCKVMLPWHRSSRQAHPVELHQVGELPG